MMMAALEAMVMAVELHKVAAIRAEARCGGRWERDLSGCGSIM